MSVVVTGGIELAGMMSVEVSVPTIRPWHQVVLKGVSSPLKGMTILRDIVDGVGFGISSTSPEDAGTTVYFDVLDVEGAQQRWEASRPVQQIISTPQ